MNSKVRSGWTSNSVEHIQPAPCSYSLSARHEDNLGMDGDSFHGKHG